MRYKVLVIYGITPNVLIKAMRFLASYDKQQLSIHTIPINAEVVQ
jgi:hypothetical protein